DQLGGIIDFYNGCTGDLLFDLAIVVNDWASNDDGSLNAERYDALLSAYQARRPLTSDERALWPTMLRVTALRYWLSRLLVVYVDPPAHDLTPHDPERFRTILNARIAHGALPLPEVSA
ncbi:MAG: phosphotransferase, partial [Halomonas sp.]